MSIKKIELLLKKKKIILSKIYIFESNFSSKEFEKIENIFLFPPKSALLKMSQVSRLHKLKYKKKWAKNDYILVKRSYRDKIINYLNKNKIGATFHYLPLHESYFFRRNFKKNFNLKVSNDIANKIVRLPISHNLKKKQFDHIIKHLFRFFRL